MNDHLQDCSWFPAGSWPVGNFMETPVVKTSISTCCLYGTYYFQKYGSPLFLNLPWVCTNIWAHVHTTSGGHQSYNQHLHDILIWQAIGRSRRSCQTNESSLNVPRMAKCIIITRAQNKQKEFYLTGSTEDRCICHFGPFWHGVVKGPCLLATPIYCCWRCSIAVVSFCWFQMI